MRVQLWARAALKSFPQRGEPGGKSAKTESDRGHVKTGVESAAAVEADFLRVEFVEIVKDAADGVALVVVGLLFKNADGDRAGVEHQIFADVAAGIGEPVGKFAGRGKQKQARSFGAVRGENDRFGFLQMYVFLVVEIDGAGGAAPFVDFNLVNVAVGTDFAFARFFGEGNHAGERAGLGSYFAGERQTETAIDAGAAPSAGLRKNGHGRGKGIPAEFARGAFEDHAVGFLPAAAAWDRAWSAADQTDWRRRDRRRRLPIRPWCSRARDRRRRSANRPEWSPATGADFAALLEIDFVEAPEICGEVIAGAADGAAVNQSALRLGFVLGRLAESIGLQLGMIGEQIFLQHFDFVVDEIFGFVEVRPLFEHHDAETVGGKFLGQNAAGGAGTNDHKIDDVGSLVFGLIGRHCLSSFRGASGAIRCCESAGLPAGIVFVVKARKEAEIRVRGRGR